jgi:hypothetical protein
MSRREASLDAGATLRVKVRESTFYNVKVAELEAWLKRSGGKPYDQRDEQEEMFGETMRNLLSGNNLPYKKFTASAKEDF